MVGCANGHSNDSTAKVCVVCGSVLVTGSALLAPAEPVANRNFWRLRNLAFVVGGGAVILLFVLGGVYFIAQRGNGGPIAGGASSPSEFLASFPESWACKTPNAGPSDAYGDSELVTCQGQSRVPGSPYDTPPGATFVWVQDIDQLISDAEADGWQDVPCAVLSGHTVASWLGYSSASAEAQESTLTDIENAFKGSTDRIGPACP
ncbi:MAG TPA: hypothetical protein VMT88_06065 [Actinomycetes bacterium]|nr:hypothetical protein [Actinomycetes bacterium]